MPLAHGIKSVRRSWVLAVGAFGLFTTVLVVANLLWIGEASPRKGFPLPYAWVYRGETRTSLLPLLPNSIVAAGLSAPFAWGVTQRFSRAPAIVEQPENKRMRVLGTTAWLIFGPLAGLVFGGALGWSIVSGVLNLGGAFNVIDISATWSIGFGLFGGVVGMLLGLSLGFALAVKKTTDF